MVVNAPLLLLARNVALLVVESTRTCLVMCQYFRDRKLDSSGPWISSLGRKSSLPLDFPDWSTVRQLCLLLLFCTKVLGHSLFLLFLAMTGSTDKEHDAAITSAPAFLGSWTDRASVQYQPE
jgi:hypothetical protein